jgi:hypothetical protein
MEQDVFKKKRYVFLRTLSVAKAMFEYEYGASLE